MARKHKLRANGELIDHIWFMPEYYHGVVRIGLFYRFVGRRITTVGTVDSDPFDSVLKVDLIEQKFAFQ